jgi:hypothetical protein
LIGLRDLYAQLQAIDRSVTTLSAQVQMATQQQNQNAASVAQQLADIRHDQNDHEARLRFIESKPVVTPKAMWAAIGILAPIVSAIITIIIALVLGK